MMLVILAGCVGLFLIWRHFNHRSFARKYDDMIAAYVAAREAGETPLIIAQYGGFAFYKNCDYSRLSKHLELAWSESDQPGKFIHFYKWTIPKEWY